MTNQPATQDGDFVLAQLNIAQMKYVADAPEMQDFVDNIDRINALAESSPGFLWRLKTDEGNAMAVRTFGDDMLVNLSVWEDLASLRGFVFETAHVEIMRRRTEWFERMTNPYAVLWWVRRGAWPTPEEAKVRLEKLQSHGPQPDAFTFAKVFEATS